jgi:hypothetical protein
MSTIPMVTEQKIRTFVGEQNFLKGQQGVRDGAIVNPEQQAMALKAYCYGSLPALSSHSGIWPERVHAAKGAGSDPRI